MGARIKRQSWCEKCKKRPGCREACARLKAELKKVSGYQREVLVSDERLEALAERAAVASISEPESPAAPLEWTRAGMLALLTRRQSQVLELVFWQGLTVAGAAERLRIHRGAAGRRYRNALERLRRQIRQPGSRCDSSED